MKLSVVVYSRYLIEWIYLVSYVVLYEAFLRSPWLFGLRLHRLSSYLVRFFFLAASPTVTWPLIYSVFCIDTPSLWKIQLGSGPSIWFSFSFLWFYLSYFFFRVPAHANLTYLYVYGSIISHIISAWSRDPNNPSFQDWVSWTLRSANIYCTAIEYVRPRCTWLSWSLLLPPIMEVRWEYSWIDWFACSETYGSLLLGQFLWVWNLFTWYLGGLVHPSCSSPRL